MKNSNKKVYLVNLGCSKNQVDAEFILGEMSQLGYSIVKSQAEANIVIINTCGFIADAKEESIDEIIAHAKAKTKGQILIAAGCLSQRYMNDLKDEIPEVDIWMGTYKPQELLKALGEDVGVCAHIPPRILIENDEPFHAFLKIAEGCSRRCAYCAIPNMRGSQISSTIEELVEQAKVLESEGIKEISLIAQDLSFYGREKNVNNPENLVALLKALIAETNISWFRLMYAYPAFLSDELISLIANEDRICKYLDMPIQHASDSILKNMRRGHSGESLRTLLRKLRKDIPNLALRTTVLVGFPGETDDDFQDLLDIIEEIKFDRLGGFAYSPEEGTPAEVDEELLKLERVPSDVAQNRLNQVMELQSMISLERNQSLIGQEMDVLVDSIAEESEFHFYARTQWDAPEIDNQVRILEGDATPGEFVKVRIVDAYEYDLDAVIVED